MVSKFRPMKVDPSFRKEINEINLERIKRGIDNKFLGATRITKGLLKQPSWKNVKEELIKARREER